MTTKKPRKRNKERYVRLLDTRGDNRRFRRVAISIVAGDRYCDGRCVGLRRMYACGCWLFQQRLRYIRIGYTDAGHGVHLSSYEFLRCIACVRAEAALRRG